MSAFWRIRPPPPLFGYPGPAGECLCDVRIEGGKEKKDNDNYLPQGCDSVFPLPYGGARLGLARGRTAMGRVRGVVLLAAVG